MKNDLRCSIAARHVEWASMGLLSHRGASPKSHVLRCIALGELKQRLRRFFASWGEEWIILVCHHRGKWVRGPAFPRYASISWSDKWVILGMPRSIFLAWREGRACKNVCIFRGTVSPNLCYSAPKIENLIKNSPSVVEEPIPGLWMAPGFGVYLISSTATRPWCVPDHFRGSTDKMQASLQSNSFLSFYHAFQNSVHCSTSYPFFSRTARWRRNNHRLEFYKVYIRRSRSKCQIFDRCVSSNLILCWWFDYVQRHRQREYPCAINKLLFIFISFV